MSSRFKAIGPGKRSSPCLSHRQAYSLDWESSALQPAAGPADLHPFGVSDRAVLPEGQIETPRARLVPFEQSPPNKGAVVWVAR